MGLHIRQDSLSACPKHLHAHLENVLCHAGWQHRWGVAHQPACAVVRAGHRSGKSSCAATSARSFACLVQSRMRLDDALLLGNIICTRCGRPFRGCSDNLPAGAKAAECRHLTHLTQCYFLLPSQIGLKLMQDDGKVFSCYTNMWDTIFYSELGRCQPQNASRCSRHCADLY